MNPILPPVFSHLNRLIIAVLGLCSAFPLMAADPAFPPTAPETNEIKTLPAGMLLKSSASGSYFNHSDELFGPLFRYISDHDIAMTTPVEATIDDAAMMFWVAPGEMAKVTGSQKDVDVLTVPQRTVASRGGKGGYNEANYQKTRDALAAWLETQTEWRTAGEPSGVYWNGPFTPWFLKTYEVHIPVERVDDLSSHRWKDRILIVEAPSPTDPDFVAQQDRFDRAEAEMRERDLVVKPRFGSDIFRITLIGKDGGRKLRQTELLDLNTLFSLIDSMPMRKTATGSGRDM